MSAMDHRQFVSSLALSDRLRLTERSNWRGLRHLAGHWALIGICGTGVALGVPGWPFLMLPLGVALVFLFTLQHETTHLTPFRWEWLNRWVGAICGVILLLPPTWFRLFHLAHHRHTQDPHHDPELAAPKPETPSAYAWHLTGIPVWHGQIRTLLRNAAGRNTDAFVPPRRRAAIQHEAQAMLALYAALAGASLWTGSAMLLWLWVIPMLLGQPFLRLYLLAEHGRCPQVADMLSNSRTTLTNRAVRFIAWNMPFHAEHHAWPTVPFHRLPALHDLARPYLTQTTRGYATFHRDYLRDLRGDDKEDGAPIRIRT